MTATQQQEQEPTIQAVPDLPEEETLTPEQAVARVAELEAELARAGQTMVDFKAKVRSEAMRMAEQHSLCEVVEQTLGRIGINTVKVRFEWVQPMEQVRTVEVPEDLMASLSEEELVNWLRHQQVPRGRTAREFREVRLTGNINRNLGEYILRPVQRRETPTRNGVTLPRTHIGAFTGREGRSMHIVSNPRGVEPDANGLLRDLRRYGAMCGATSYEWRIDSPRDSGNICRRCAERAGLVAR